MITQIHVIEPMCVYFLNLIFKTVRSLICEPFIILPIEFIQMCTCTVCVTKNNVLNHACVHGMYDWTHLSVNYPTF
jgi:hypothetical protein